MGAKKRVIPKCNEHAQILLLETVPINHGAWERELSSLDPRRETHWQRVSVWGLLYMLYTFTITLA